MSTASILTLDSAKTLSSGSLTTLDLDWDTETQYLDADILFHGVDPRNLRIPASLDGVPYEVFLWVEDDVNDWGSGSGCYMGMLSSGLTPGMNSWGIIRDMGYASRGVRTGPVRGLSTVVDWFTQGREFQVQTFAPGTRSRLGVITDPRPIAVACGRESGYTTGSTEKNMDLNEDFDIGDVYNPATGVYTAPAGASLAAVNVAGYINSATGVRLNYALDRDGTEIARYEAQHSLRGNAPATFGLLPVAAGEELVIRISDDQGNRDGDFSHSVEFY